MWKATKWNEWVLADRIFPLFGSGFSRSVFVVVNLWTGRLDCVLFYLSICIYLLLAFVVGFLVKTCPICWSAVSCKVTPNGQDEVISVVSIWEMRCLHRRRRRRRWNHRNTINSAIWPFDRTPLSLGAASSTINQQPSKATTGQENLGKTDDENTIRFYLFCFFVFVASRKTCQHKFQSGKSVSTRSTI